MFRRARLSVKPNVRPTAGARSSAAAAPQRGPGAPRRSEPASPAAPQPSEPADVAPADIGGAEPQEKAPRSSDEKTDGENDVEESSKSSSVVSQRRKRISSTSSLAKPNVPLEPTVSVPLEPQPLSAASPAPDPVPAAEKQPCSDRYRIYKAQKLREMLKEELRKEKKQWKNKYATNESLRPPDRSKMTMRDFIYYLPDNNPMTSSLEQEKRTEKSLTTAQTREQENKNPPDNEDNEDIEEETDDGPLLVPRVKVAEDGSIILDEESLTVEVLRTKGPCVVEENDPIFERGSTTTYSSFRKNYYSKPWSNKETDMFFLAISMVGTDFSMIGQLFPHRARIEIKNKFKREEKTNGWRIDKAFQEKRPFDFDFFAHLLQKVLAEEEKRKKSVKSQPLKEKKSKPQKNVKVKKVASAGVSDEPDESVGSKVSDSEGSQKDAQTVEEQLSSSPEQDLEQVASESDLSQNKRRKKNQDEIGKQAVRNHSENAAAQPEPSEGEKQHDKCQSLRNEINEDEGSKEQMLFCVQNSEDIGFFTENVEERTDPILSSSSQQDVTSFGGESLESRVSDSLPSDVDVGALCELSLAKGGSEEERTVDVENKAPEADQVANVKPKVRGRLQRPKPNLSRAVGKKPVLTQSKTLAESKCSHPEASIEKSNMEKDEMNAVDTDGTENSEGKNPVAETVSNSSEKTWLHEDDQPKVVRPARLVRGRLQRPKPNIGKAAERKEAPRPQDGTGAGVEKGEVQSCADRNSPEEVEDQSCKTFECEDVMSQPEKNNTCQNIQLEDPKTPNECLSSIQEDSTSNIFKEVPILKTQFQKPKPSTGRGIRKREMFSKEEVAEESLDSEKMTAPLREIARLEISPREELPMEVETTQEVNSCLKEPGRRDISPKEKLTEKVDTTEEMETDLEEIGVEIPSSQTVVKMIDVIEEEESGFRETGVEIPPSETVLEVTKIIEEKESDLKETGAEISPSKVIPELADVTEEEPDLKETGQEFIPCQRIAEVIEITEEKESDLKEIGEEITPCQRIAERKMTEEKESDLKETEFIPCQRIAEEIGITAERVTDLREMGDEITPCQSIAEMIELTKERETDRKEIEEIKPHQRIAEMRQITEKKESDLKEIEEITPCQRKEMIEITEEKELDLNEIGDEITPCQRIAEMIENTKERETDNKEIEEITQHQRIAEEIEISEERETYLEETRKKEISQKVNVPNEDNTFGEIETKLRGTGREISLREKALVGISAMGEREVFMKETGKGDTFLLEKTPGKVTAIEADMEETQGDISLMKSRSEEIVAEEMVADLKIVRPVDISLRENETEDPGISRQTEPDLTQDRCGDCSASPLNATNISSELLPIVQTSVEEKASSEMETSSSVHSLQIPDCDIIEDQGLQSTDIQEQFSDVSLSQLLPDKQKPAEVKPAPFVRNRLKRPKPNLARAALKRETMAAKTSVPGKTLEAAGREDVVLQQGAGLASTVPAPHNVAPLMTSGEKDESCPEERCSGALPSVQTEQDPPTGSRGSKEEAESTPAPGENVAVAVGTQSTNSLQQEVKKITTQSAVPVRGRPQRPRPNIKKAGQRHGQRQVAVGVEPKAETLQDGRTTLQKEEAEKNLLDAANSQLGIEIEVVSSKISECRMNDTLDEQKSYEHNAVPSIAPLVRRPIQKAKPNLGRAHGKKEERCPGKDRASQSEPREPEENLLQGDSDTPQIGKDNSELQTSHEISARRETVGDNSVSSNIKEQHLNKPPSCPQLLRESSHPKITFDRRTPSSSTSEREVDHSERRMHRKTQSNASRGRGSKRVRTKAPKKEPRTSKAVLVTLRASQEEEDDDVDDFELDYEEESYHLAPEEVNKAPVFVPIGLRSPEPVTTQIEETMEELEITVNVPDVGCIAVVEHGLPNTDVTPQEVKQDVSENMLTVEVTTSEHTQNEAGPSDGSTEAAIALLTMGDLVLQSEMGTEHREETNEKKETQNPPFQGLHPHLIGICVLPDVQSRDKNHIPFSPDHVNHSIVHECQDLSSPVTTTSLPSLEENKIILEGQSTTEKIELKEKAKEETLSNRSTASAVTGNLRMRSRFAKPKVNLKKILGTSRVGAHRGVPSLSGTKGEEEIHRETEKSDSNAAELEENLKAVTAVDSKEQSRLACTDGVQGSLDPEPGTLSERNEDQEVESQQAQILSVAPVVAVDPSSSLHMLGLSEALGESPTEVPPAQDFEDGSVLSLHVPECVSTNIPEIQEQNAISSQDLTVNVHQDNEDEHTFILTLVEIPTNEVEEFSDNTAPLLPNPLLPAPILVKSVNTEETGDLSANFPVTSISQDDTCFSNSGKESEKPPANLDVSRKRFHQDCLDESDSVPPTKKSLFASVDNCEKYSSEVHSKELTNVFEETGVSHKEQNNVPAPGSIPTTPESHRRQPEPSALQITGFRSLDKIEKHLEKTPPHLPQDKMVRSDKEERAHSTFKSEQMDNRPSSSKTSLSRPGRRPLGFLSLICSKSSLESDEPTQFHKKKRPKPLIPVSRQNLKRSNQPSESHKTNPESSDVLPSPSGVSTTSETLNSSAAASQVSCDHLLLEEKCKSGPNQAPGEEPPTVSEYFFGDIFIEVNGTE